MSPTITRAFDNLVISTGNIINSELGRKSSEELFDGLRETLHTTNNSAAPAENAEQVQQLNVGELNGEVQRGTQELANKLTENGRNEISIAAKIFLNKNSSAHIEQAIESVLKILNIEHVDNVVLAYHPNTTATTTTPQTPTKTPCAESLSFNTTSTASAAVAATRNWTARNGEPAVAELQELYSKLENFALEKQIIQLGLADLDAGALEQVHAAARVAPTIAQVNLATCCVVPTELQDFCTAHDIQLLTHADPECLLSSEQFANLAPGYTIDWILRYQVHVRCRGVLTAKGYIVGATKA